MSYEQRPQTWLDQAPEILLNMTACLDHLGRINLAIALPELFMSPRLNIFREDAEQQVIRQRRMARTPLIETEDMMPLLYAAIKHDVDISVIEEIIKIYKSVCATSIDGIWGEHLTAFPPPLSFASGLGKPRVVSLLLDQGADHSLKHSLKTYIHGPDCTLSGFIHSTCNPTVRGITTDQTSCGTAIDQTIFVGRSTVKNVSDVNYHNLEECAMILHERGAKLLCKPVGMDPRVDASFQEIIHYPVVAGFTRLVRTILDPIVEVRRGEEQFQMNLYYALQAAWSFQICDDHLDMIKYLLSVGAPLDPPSLAAGVRRVDLTYAALSFFRRRPKTGALFFDAYIEQQVPLEYGMLFHRRHHRNSEAINTPFVEALYHAIKHGNNFYRGKRVSDDFLLEGLLSAVLYLETAGAAEYLIERGVGTGAHVHMAISRLNKVSLQSLLNAGHSVNQPVTQTPGKPEELPLELALGLGYMDMAKFLIDRGADPSLLPSEARQIFETEYARQWGSVERHRDYL